MRSWTQVTQPPSGAARSIHRGSSPGSTIGPEMSHPEPRARVAPDGQQPPISPPREASLGEAEGHTRSHGWYSAAAAKRTDALFPRLPSEHSEIPQAELKGCPHSFVRGLLGCTT